MFHGAMGAGESECIQKRVVDQERQQQRVGRQVNAEVEAFVTGYLRERLSAQAQAVLLPVPRRLLALA